MIGKFSYFRGGIKNTSKSESISLQQAVWKLANTDKKDQLLKLRATSDKSLRAVLKKDLDYFTFSGTFKKREESGLITHSGIICIDFDLNGLHKVKNEDGSTTEVFITEYNIPQVKYQLTLDPHTLCCFISPSGDGIKVLVKIDPAFHLASFKWLEKYYQEQFNLTVDPSGKDIPRACFISYDDAPFINLEATKCPVEEGFVPDEKRPTQPTNITSNNAIREDFKIDEETGEVIDYNDLKTWPRKKVEDLERCQLIAGRVFQKSRDITSSYDDWQMVAFSLAVFGEHGRPIFHKVSQFNPEYNYQEADKKFTNAIQTGRFENCNKFYSIVKSYGIDNKMVRSIQGGVAEGAEGSGYQDFKFEVPDGVEITNELREHVYTYNFFEYKNQYWYAKFDNNKRQVDFFTISNFIITPLFLIMSRSEPKRIVEISNIRGRSKVLDIPAEAFTSPQQLYAFIESNGNFLFDGERKHLQKIKAKLYDLAKEANEMRVLGWHKEGFFAFSNGIYTPDGFLATDDYGVVEYNNNTYFMPALSSIYKDEEEDFEAQKKFVFIKNKITFKEWADRFINVHKENGQIGLCFFLSSLFRDLIYDHFKFFPLLFGFGPPGTGKSQMGWSFSFMFGEAQIPFNLNGGTKVAFHKTFAMFRNAIVWFDEYNNAIDQGRVQSLKSSYDGSGHQKSEMTQANRTKSTPVHSSALITGQELPISDNALFKRVILNEYHQNQFSEEERRAHDDFREIEKRGLSHITAHLTTLRPIMEANYFEMFELTVKDIGEELGDSYSKTESRIIQNYAIIMATFRTLQNHIQMPVTYAEILKLGVERITSQNKLIGSSNETNMFWDLVQFMHERGYTKMEVDYKIRMHATMNLQKGNDDEKLVTFKDVKSGESVVKKVIYIRLSSIHPLYLDLHRKQYNKSGMDKGSIIHYLQHEMSYLGKVSSTRFSEQNTFAYCFDYEMLEKIGLNLEKIVEGIDTLPEDSATKNTKTGNSSTPEFQFIPNQNQGTDDNKPF